MLERAEGARVRPDRRAFRRVPGAGNLGRWPSGVDATEEPIERVVAGIGRRVGQGRERPAVRRGERGGDRRRRIPQGFGGLVLISVENLPGIREKQR